MADERVRIEVAFDGGQTLSILTEQEAADELVRALANGDEAAKTIEADDGRYTVALRRVVYVKRFARESRVGFSTG